MEDISPELRLAMQVAEMTESDEFKKASELVKKYDKTVENLKKVLKAKGKKHVTWKRKSTIYQLEFIVSEQLRFDPTTYVPDDIKTKYMKNTEIWRKKLSAIELNEVVGV